MFVIYGNVDIGMRISIFSRRSNNIETIRIEEFNMSWNDDFREISGACKDA
jgi:hypothetical protein